MNSRMRKGAVPGSRFKVQGSRFKVQGLTWNFELGTLNGASPITHHQVWVILHPSAFILL
jgi:hypothetical protein